MYCKTLWKGFLPHVTQPYNTSDEKWFAAFMCCLKQPFSKVKIGKQRVNGKMSLFIFPACTSMLTEGNRFHPFLLTSILVLIFCSLHLLLQRGLKSSVTRSLSASIAACLIKRARPERREANNTHPLSHTHLNYPN